MKGMGRAVSRARGAWGFAALAVLVPIYFVLSADDVRPLALFGLAPLIAALIAPWRVVLAVTAASAVVTTLVWQMDQPISTRNFVVRLSIVVLGGIAATLGSAIRQRREEELIEARAREQVTAAFVSQLVPRPMVIGHCEVDLHYAAAEHRLELGGDFVDVRELADGSVAFVLGDVCGHGPEAAALGVAMRAGWRAATTASSHPDQWLAALEHGFFTTGEFTTFVTVVTGRVLPDGRTCELSLAGHPPPILLGAQPRFAAVASDPPVGMGIPETGYRRSTRISITSDGMLLFTDGAYEVLREKDGRHGTLDDLLAEVQVHSTFERGDLDRFATHLAPPTRHAADDVTLVLVRPRPQT